MRLEGVLGVNWPVGFGSDRLLFYVHKEHIGKSSFVDLNSSVLCVSIIY